ncbi:unnamed protein product [Lactuca virosa]|uniref:Uncharacterized protein n=1 Tax=Lactuca virosa TaxID=75947 RepID=A0AAU9LP93_9ASTR|nr:unnamed protein product [Lactuca virosa]
MGLHLVALAKVKLLGVSKLHGAPFVAILAWPLFLKVVLSLRPFQNLIMSVAQESRLFVFQLNQIIGFQAAGRSRADHGFDGNRRRWERVIRLVQERLPNVGRSMPFEDYDQSLQALSIVAF